MTLFQNTYRVESSRLKDWDYSSPGMYCITIAIKNRERLFGDIVDGKMVYSDIGTIIDHYWHAIPQHFSNVSLDAFAIMPDHMHGIIKIEGDVVVETPKLGVSTMQTTHKSDIAPKKRANIGIIVNQFKRMCTINIRKTYSGFAWQSRFYDHIIRDDEELLRVRQYIIDNPKKWNDVTMHDLTPDEIKIIKNPQPHDG